jgi:hypothetical protein
MKKIDYSSNKIALSVNNFKYGTIKRKILIYRHILAKNL